MVLLNRTQRVGRWRPKRNLMELRIRGEQELESLGITFQGDYPRAKKLVRAQIAGQGKNYGV